jgi:hypothetical protein
LEEESDAKVVFSIEYSKSLNRYNSGFIAVLVTGSVFGILGWILSCFKWIRRNRNNILNLTVRLQHQLCHSLC